MREVVKMRSKKRNLKNRIHEVTTLFRYRTSISGKSASELRE